MERLTTVELYYLAAMLDFGGGIYISKTSGTRSSTPVYKLEVIFVNSDPRAFVVYREKLDELGSLRRDGNKGWRWVITNLQAQGLLLLVEPYLRLRSEQALIGIRFANTVPQRTSRKLPEKILKIREQCFLSIRQHKRRSYRVKRLAEVINS